jgi:diadenosine tetraphosphate (Ap4A) HIT family hydrolase
VATNTDCELCTGPGGDLLWADGLCRVVRVTGPEGSAFPGYCRVVWRRHVAEMSALAANEAHHVMNVVLATERAVRRLVGPDKINLASLGNLVPHLHWHVIPRWKDDSHFPAAIWAEPQRSGIARPIPASATLLGALQAELWTLNESP